LAGVPAAENQGVWVTGSNGITPVVITGQQLVYSNNELKTVKAIGIFQQPAIVQGQSRSFSAGTGNLVYEATFTDGTWGIYEVNLP
jgi:hypothetical protein